MSRIVMTTITLTMFILFWQTPAVSNEPMERHVANDVVASFSDQIKVFLMTVMHADYKSHSLLSEKRPTKLEPHSIQEIYVNKGIDGQEYILRIDTQNGTIYLALHSGRFGGAEQPKELPLAKAITEVEAFKSVGRVLDHYGLKLAHEDFSYLLRKRPEPGLPRGNVNGSFWHFNVSRLKYEDIPCAFAFLQVDVNAFSGEIVLVRYEPIILPNQVEREVSKESAIKSAETWLPSEKYFVGKRTVLDKSPNNVEKVIALPIDFFKMDEDLSLRTPVQSYLCWEVPFTFTEDDWDFHGGVWVNIETGKIVGAGERHDKDQSHKDSGPAPTGTSGNP